MKLDLRRHPATHHHLRTSIIPLVYILTMIVIAVVSAEYGVASWPWWLWVGGAAAAAGSVHLLIRVGARCPTCGGGTRYVGVRDPFVPRDEDGDEDYYSYYRCDGCDAEYPAASFYRPQTLNIGPRRAPGKPDESNSGGSPRPRRGSRGR